MFGLFNRQNPVKAGLQAYNLLVITLGAYELYKHPEKFAEFGADIFVHTVTFLSLQQNQFTLGALGSAALNIARLGSIYTGVTSGCTSVSGLSNAGEVVNHLVNAGVLLLGDSKDSDAESKNKATATGTIEQDATAENDASLKMK